MNHAIVPMVWEKSKVGRVVIVAHGNIEDSNRFQGYRMPNSDCNRGYFGQELFHHLPSDHSFNVESVKESVIQHIRGNKQGRRMAVMLPRGTIDTKGPTCMVNGVRTVRKRHNTPTYKIGVDRLRYGVMFYSLLKAPSIHLGYRVYLEYSKDGYKTYKFFAKNSFDKQSCFKTIWRVASKFKPLTEKPLMLLSDLEALIDVDFQRPKMRS